MSELENSVQETAQARVYAALRSALMKGEFLPGERMVVRNLSERFETSPMPVREALHRLVSEEALVDNANRGVMVPEVSAKSIIDLSRVRSGIEGMAAEWAASTIDYAEIEQMVAFNQGMKIASQEARVSDFLALNRDFHFTIYKASRSDAMLAIISRLWLQAGPWLNLIRAEATLGLGLDHHAEIIEALRRGEGMRARWAIAADISETADIIARGIDSNDLRERTRMREPVDGRSRRKVVRA